MGYATGSNLGIFAGNTVNQLSAPVDVHNVPLGAYWTMIAGHLYIAVRGPVTLIIDGFTTNVIIQEADIPTTW